MKINARPCALLTRCDAIERATAVPVPTPIASRKSFVRHDRARFCRAEFRIQLSHSRTIAFFA